MATVTRKRVHAVEDLLDGAEQLVTLGDPSGLTLRALATATGASNGTIYHAFSSKEQLLALLWLRASARLDALMTQARADVADESDGVAAVVAVALAPLDLCRRYPASARLFFAQRADQLFSDALPTEVEEQLDALRARLLELMVSLARGVWGRTDRHAVEAVAVCLVDLPTGILRRRILEGSELDPATGARLEAAVRAVLSVPLAPAAPDPRTSR